MYVGEISPEAVTELTRRMRHYQEAAHAEEDHATANMWSGHFLAYAAVIELLTGDDPLLARDGEANVLSGKLDKKRENEQP